MKTWNDRVRETIAYISNLAAGPNHQHAAPLADLLTERNRGNVLQVVGEQMAQGSYALLQNRAEQERYRMQRRALILIHSVFLNRTPAQAVATANSIAEGTLGTQLGLAIGLARGALLLDLDTKWTQLTNHPAVFLQQNPIIVRSTPAGGLVPYEFGWSPTTSCYRIEPAAGHNPHNHFQVQKTVNLIPVTNYPLVKHNLGALAGVQANPAHPVVTTQLTGCSYVFQLHAGALTAAHICPAGDIEPRAQCGMLRGAPPPPLANLGPAAFAGAGAPATVFGAEAANSPSGYVHSGTWTYVVGVHGAGGWQLHIQQQPRGGGAITYWRAV